MAGRIAVPVCVMRGGTSKGVFVNAKHLPDDVVKRDKYLLAIMGSPDPRQIDGLGGAHSLTSKVGIVSCSDGKQYDLEFLFAQLQPDSAFVDTEPNCGNMLAAVVPFALETGMVSAKENVTTMRVLTKNTGMISEITVETPNGRVNYEGESRIDGVPGTSSPIYIKFLDTEGSICGSLFPTGQKRDVFTLSNGEKIEVTCIDNGMPMVLIRAKDFGLTGYESPEIYNKNKLLKEKINELRLVVARKMGLGDVSDKNYPKMCLLAPAISGGTIHTRCYIPHICHEAIGVLAAVTVGTATIYPDSIAYDMASGGQGDKVLSIEHPTGEFSVALDVAESAQGPKVVGASLLRTARMIMKGEVYLSPKN